MADFNSYPGCPEICYDGPCICDSRIDEENKIIHWEIMIEELDYDAFGRLF